MKIMPHVVFAGLLLASIGAAIAVPEIWFLPVLMAVVLVGYVVFNRQLAKQETAGEHKAADLPT